MNQTEPRSVLRQIPPGVWVLGGVSMLMDISSEMVHSLLPMFMVTTLGISVWAVGLIEGLAESTALIIKIFSERVYDLLSSRAKNAKWMNCKLVLSNRSQFFHNPPVLLQPVKAALNHPALRHDLEGVQFAALGDLHRDMFAKRLAHALCKRLARVAAVAQHALSQGQAPPCSVPAPLTPLCGPSPQQSSPPQRVADLGCLRQCGA